MDSYGHFKNGRYVGRTTFRDGLVNSVVALSVKEVAGVSGIANGFSGFSVRAFLKADGVKIIYDVDGIIINLCITMHYGYAAAEVIYRVQENVISAAGGMLDKKIKAINIKVVGIDAPSFNEIAK